MSKKHTPTLWAFSDTDYLSANGVKARFCEIVEQTKTFAHYRLFEVQNPAEDKVIALLGCGPASYDNARRIVACVNRLTAFTTEDIENPAIDLFGISASQQRIWNAEQQRDELLATLKKLAVATSHYRVELAAFVGFGANQPCDAERAAYIAIAKTKTRYSSDVESDGGEI
ncbi:hypothetical protein [Deefgea piscis]|uniref:hypothetical protein n=1 Tax=Deefgea piscis TaxID=2739061 RepID=UPI001C820735|nr:hypothetical protein [Deefgea piscis]QZA80214.1 hypothetical protein K4H25_11790 [Deefgea piscis]